MPVVYKIVSCSLEVEIVSILVMSGGIVCEMFGDVDVTL